MRRFVAGPLLVAAAAVACAQPQAPPGGEPDAVAPRVVTARPGPFDTVAAFRGSAVLEFNERISEQFQDVATLEEAVVVSPRTGAVRAERGRRSVEVSLAGGWQPDRVYTITIRPVLRDLFGNVMDEPLVLVFSTGAEIPETALAGFVRDRITGDPAVDARVRAVAPDSAVYQAVADTSGFFAIRYLPPGSYDLQAWQDVNRDLGIGFQEAQWDTTATVAAGDTVAMELAILPRDTSAARLTVAEALDSTTISLLFDDYFAAGPVEGTATVYTVPDSVAVHTGPLVHGSRLDSLRAVREGAAADTVQDDRDQGGPEAEPLPTRELILVLPVPLAPGESYAVVVEGVTNIRGLPGGGGTARFVAPVPAPPEEPGDTIPAEPGDTVPSEPGDTLPAEPGDTPPPARP